MYSLHNEGKSVIAERFIRTSKYNIYKNMTSVSRNVYIDKLDDIVNEYNNTYHSTIKINDKDCKFKIDDIVSISTLKVLLLKVTLQSGLKKLLW